MGVVAGGVVALAKHSATPGVPADSHAGMLTPSLAHFASDRMMLLMFVHPRCPCSEASIAELSQLMDRCGSKVKTTVVIFQSSHESEEWNHSAIWSAAQHIPGVVTRSDLDGTLAKQAGANTSGQVFLYGTDGNLVFDGGITASRGHFGDNDGLDSVTRIILADGTGNPRRASAPVFGCAITSAP